ncbi:MAG: S9 family peptidase [Actinomycetota bacterium]
MTRPFHPEDLHLVRQVSEVRWHPDGRRLAFVVSWADRETDANRSDIHLADVAAGTHRRITTAHVASGPRFSPDGRHLAYVAAPGPKDRPQLRVLDLEGGEPDVLTDLADGVRSAIWVTNDELVFVAPVRPDDQVDVDDDELGRRLRVVDTLDYRMDGQGFTHDRRAQLHRVRRDGSPGDEEQLTDAPRGVGGPVLSPGGGYVAVAVGDAERPLTSRVGVVPVAGGELRMVTEGDGDWTPLGWRSGKELLVAGVERWDEVGLARLASVDAAGGVPTTVDPDDVGRIGIGQPADVRLDDDVAHVLANRRGRTHVDRIDLAEGTGATVVDGERCVVAFDVSGDGAVAAGITTSRSPAELFVVDADGERQLTALNPWLDGIDLAVVEEVFVESTDGAQVQGWVTRPPASAPGDDPRPALVYVHGGPLWAYGPRFFDEFQVAAACGYVVIGGNPRGSDGFGTDWARAITGGRMGQPDWDDVQALTDHLAALPEVDADRIGIGGGSYGGWMTGWAIGHSDRYGAALVERAVTNWESFASTSDLTDLFGSLYLGAPEPGDVDELRRQSPVQYLDAVTTPTLVLHAESDLRCPIEQGEQMYVGLKRRGVETRMVRVPGEGHEFSRSGKPSRRVDRFGHVHDWFAHHLGGAPVPDLDD